MDKVKREIEKAIANSVKINPSRKYQNKLAQDILVDMRERENREIIGRINKGEIISARII